jgi:hypothetical protein
MPTPQTQSPTTTPSPATLNPPAAPTPAPKVYFFKALLSNAFVFKGDKVNWEPVQFEPLAGNNGVIALSPDTDAALIKALNDAATKGQYGILKISEADYIKKKQTQPWTPSAPKSWLDEPLKVAGRPGKAFRPQPPAALAREHAAADNQTQPAPDPAMADAGEVSEVQRPPDQPDFKTGNFKPAQRSMPVDSSPI